MSGTWVSVKAIAMLSDQEKCTLLLPDGWGHWSWEALNSVWHPDYSTAAARGFQRAVQMNKRPRDWENSVVPTRLREGMFSPASLIRTFSQAPLTGLVRGFGERLRAADLIKTTVGGFVYSQLLVDTCRQNFSYPLHFLPFSAPLIHGNPHIKRP